MSRRRVGISLVCLALVAASAWLAITAKDGAGDGRKAESAAGAGAAQERPPLSVGQRNHLKHVALTAPEVRTVLGGRYAQVSDLVPWRNEDGEVLLGAAVELVVSPALEMDGTVLPVEVTPGPRAKPGTPTLFRRASFRAENVTRLRTNVRLGSKGVTQIIPGGSRASIKGFHLLGPPVGKIYREPPED